MSSSHGSKVLRSMLWLALEPTVSALISISLAGFIATRLGITGYGQFTFALSFVTLFGVITNLGMSDVLMRSVARQAVDEATLWSSVMAAKAILLVLYVMVVTGAARLLGYDSSLVVVVGLLGLYQGLLSMEQTTISVFAGRQHFKPPVMLRLAKTMTDTIATVAVLLLGFSVVGLSVSRVVVTLLAAIAVTRLGISMLGVRATRPSLAVVRPLITAGMSFTLSSLLIAVGARGGVLVLEHFRGFEAVALFSAGGALVERFMVLLPAVIGALFPFFSAIRSDETHRFSSSLARALRYQVVIAVGGGLGISLFGPWILHTFFPSSFVGAARVVQILGAYAALRAVADLLKSAAQARGFEKQVVFVWGCQCTVNLVAAALLVGHFGAVGLAWAMVAADTILLSLLLLLLARAGCLASVRWAPLLSAAAAGVLLFVAFAFVGPARPGFGVLLLVAVLYPIVLAMSPAVSREDWRYLTLLFRRGSIAQASGPVTIGATEG